MSWRRARKERETIEGQRAYAKEYRRALSRAGKVVDGLTPPPLPAPPPRKAIELSGEAPDAFHPIVAYKYMFALADGTLSSPMKHMPWTEDSYESICRYYGHKTCSEGCLCGFHMVDAKSHYLLSYGSPIVAMYGWGTVVTHNDGYRTQYAAIAAILLPNNNYISQIDEKQVDLIKKKYPNTPLLRYDVSATGTSAYYKMLQEAKRLADERVTNGSWTGSQPIKDRTTEYDSGPSGFPSGASGSVYFSPYHSYFTTGSSGSITVSLVNTYYSNTFTSQGPSFSWYSGTGKLSTKNPVDPWDVVMRKHFPDAK